MTVLCLVALLLGAPTASGHRPVAELEAEVRRLRALEARYKSLERGLLGDLEQITRELDLADRELDLARARLDDGETRARAIESELAAMTARMSEDRSRLRQSLLTGYSRRGPDWLRVLFASGDPAELPRNLRLISFLGAAQEQALRRFAAESARLATARRNLDAQNESVTRLRVQAEQRRADMARAQTRKEQTLREMSGRKQQTVRELQAAAHELSSLVGGLSQERPLASTGFANLRGRLPWPLDAPIRRGFGSVMHPRFHTQIQHSGVELAAPVGSPVRAVHAGTVAFADWFRGYGLMAILDHGDGYYTLYARLLDIQVSRGEVVEAGRRLGRSGDTGAEEGPGLYFEVRKGDAPQNPAAWLAPASRRNR